MTRYVVTLPNGQTIELPETAAAAVDAAAAKYPEPLWEHREERVLKLAHRQWVWPDGPVAALSLYERSPAGVVAVGWKLFNRGWSLAADAYWREPDRYPNHPRRLGQGVIPLVDEDDDNQQIGWVRVLQATAPDQNFAVFVQFLLLECFAPRPLPPEYA